MNADIDLSGNVVCSTHALNPATELGRGHYEWWPDWQGKRIAIVASGPSTKKEDVHKLRGRLPVIAIKENVELAPWADIVYGCDYPWWQNNNGLPKFSGLKLAFARETARFPDVLLVNIQPRDDSILVDEPLKIGSGGNSGFQALNLAVQFGAVGIMLIGFDMQDRSGVHWYGRNNGPGRNNPSQDNFKRWIAAFTKASGRLRDLGVTVINVSPITDLDCFRRQTVDLTLQTWGL
jgi:hypothetical protein